MSKEAFSLREIEVIELVMLGHNNQQIGAELFIEIKSVKFHLTNIYKKAKCKSRADFMSKLFRGLLDPMLFIKDNINRMDKYF